jgi:hypothetical protein
VPSIQFQPIKVMTASQDKAGLLVLADDELAAVMVQLEDIVHAQERGKWFLEIMFKQPGQNETFASLDEAKAWIQEKLGT